ncbi:MAG: hypothetical protein ACXV9R_12120 [Methylobacter sp.]
MPETTGTLDFGSPYTIINWMCRREFIRAHKQRKLLFVNESGGGFRGTMITLLPSVYLGTQAGVGLLISQHSRSEFAGISKWLFRIQAITPD